MSFNFLTDFLKYFFRVLHEASSSWLKFVQAFQKHPVCPKTHKTGGCERTNPVIFQSFKFTQEKLKLPRNIWVPGL
jgi:hypothetical protein